MKIKMTEEERRLHRNAYQRAYRAQNLEKVTAYKRAYQLRNPEKVRAKQRAAIRAYRLRNPEKYRASNRVGDLKRNFGMTPPQYIEILRGQGGGCAICGSMAPGGKGRNFCVDHDHKTGAVRGLLCFSCNRGLGEFKDSTVALQAAICYLQSITSLLS